MRRIRVSLRLFILLFLVTVPWAGLGFALARGRGALIGSSLAVLGLMALALLAEWLLAWLYDCERDVPDGITHTLEKMRRSGEHVALDVRVFSHPVPQALVVRSLGSRGTLILSQGLLSLLPEREIRRYLIHAQKLAREPGRTLFSVGSVLACALVMLVPREVPWSLFVPVPAGGATDGTLSLWTGIRFFCVLPFFRRFLALSRSFDPTPVPFALYPGAAPLHFFLSER